MAVVLPGVSLSATTWQCQYTSDVAGTVNCLLSRISIGLALGLQVTVCTVWSAPRDMSPPGLQLGVQSTKAPPYLPASLRLPLPA